MSAQRERITFIDFLRGYAILMMLQGHTVNVVLAETWRDPKYPAFAIWHYMTGLTAPTFFFAAGFIFSYLLARGEERGGQRIHKGLKRCASLLILGWVFHIKPPFFQALLQGDLSVLGELLGRSHVLHVIGLSLLLIIALWLLARRNGKLFIALAFASSQAVFLLGPPIALWPGDEAGVLRALGTFLSRENAYFPLFPWSGYALLGAGLGALAWATKWYLKPSAFGILALIGFIHMASTGLAPEASKVYYWRGGEVLILTALVGVVFCFLAKKNWEDFLPLRVISICGQETLTIFTLHCIVLYGVWFGIGLSPFFSKEFGPWQTVATAVLVEAAFITLALNLPSLRKRFPPLELIH